MNIESISKKTGAITAKTLSGIVAAPGKTANKSKRIKDAFLAGYDSSKAPRVSDSEIIETSAV